MTALMLRANAHATKVHSAETLCARDHCTAKRKPESLSRPGIAEAPPHGFCRKTSGGTCLVAVEPGAISTP